MNNIPYLCGGTFFSLLLQGKRLRRKARDKFLGGTDGLNNTDVMKGLIYVVTGQKEEPYMVSFKKNTSLYMSCTYNGGTYIPFNETSTINSFDNAVKNRYSDILFRMSEFTNEYLIVENSEKRVWLIKALLDVIEHDADIKDEDLFYIWNNGDFATKLIISELSDIEFEPFIVGVLHYILLERKDNTLGRSTFESWHVKQPSEWSFVSDIGCGITRPINVFTHNVEKDENADFVKSHEPVEEEEEVTPDPEVITDDTSTESSIQNVTQIINNPTIVNQYGQKNVHIDHVESLNL